MATKAQNKNLHQAKNSKKDEFYTQLPDIERELKNYKDHFKDKIVYCNCDDPRVSNFFHYLSYNFENFGLKKLLATCYKNQEMDLFTLHNSEQTIYLEYDGDKNGNNVPDPEEIGIKHLKGDGDFRSKESIELLKQADIVVTNPPFSLFRDYVNQLIEYEKQFIIIGNLNALTYKEIFKLIKKNKVWLGASIHSGDREFGVPEDYPLTAANSRIDKKGNKYIRVKGVRWYTNLDYKERHEDLILYKIYNPEEYPKYENFDAINVNKTKDIPLDYKGYMGVPITFIDKYNPEQFEIIGLGISNSGKEIGVEPYKVEHKKYRKEVQKRGAVDGDLYIWISNDDIEQYMAKNQHEPNANELWLYFQGVINWVKIVFPNYRKEMKGIAWGFLYNEFKDQKLDSKKLEKEIAELMQDEDVSNKKGIYLYVLTGKEKHLNIRAFSDNQKREAYERQKGICIECKEHFEINEMEADHITPWHDGGKTSAENCQMLCRDDNRRKSGK